MIFLSNGVAGQCYGVTGMSSGGASGASTIPFPLQ